MVVSAPHFSPLSTEWHFGTAAPFVALGNPAVAGRELQFSNPVTPFYFKTFLFVGERPAHLC